MKGKGAGSEMKVKLSIYLSLYISIYISTYLSSYRFGGFTAQYIAVITQVQYTVAQCTPVRFWERTTFWTSTVQYSSVQDSTVQFDSVQYSAVWVNVQYSTEQCPSLQYT